MKNFNILGVHGKIRVLRGGFTKSQFIGEDCLQTEGLGQFADLRGGGEGRGGRAWQERGGVDTPIHTML